MAVDTQLLVNRIQKNRSNAKISKQFRTKDERLLEIRDVLRKEKPDEYGVVNFYKSKY